MFITLPDKSPLAFAGLWEIWHDKQNPGTDYRSCTIITREAAGVVKDLHHRMPVILNPDAYESWLDPDNDDKDSLNNILGTKAVTELVYHPVTKQVNSVRKNDPSNLKPSQIEFEFQSEWISI